ncbi:hypothetical protein HGI47_22000, partial [Novosphingobium sp. ERN07]|uniref:hypothetical protein n=1 Tax=Novosphingobium sp. ERN07 TaxID=2726187 RepID=UPI00145764DF
TSEGRAEGFTIGSATFANGTGPSFVNIQITPQINAQAISLAGVAGATLLPTGTIVINNVAADSNGVYRVPQSILTQLGDGDFQAILVVGGLSIGSTLTGTARVREASPIPEGLFVQTFNASGLALGDHGPRIDGGTTAILFNSDDIPNTAGLTALDGGGFVVHWVIDGGAGEGGLAIQRFAANGTKQGGVTVLQGLSPDLLNAADISSLDLQALDNGGYALTYALGFESAGRNAVVTANAANQTFGLTVVGRPEAFFVGSLPSNAQFALMGIGNDGLSRTVPLTVGEFGEIRITNAVLDQFQIDNRFTLQVSGLTQGQSGNIFISTLQDVSYAPGTALANVTSALVANSDGFSAIATGSGRAESFHIDSASFANGTGPSIVLMQITPAQGFGIDISGIPGASILPSGTIQIVGLTADANGNYRVPDALLTQLGTTDAQAILIVGGLTAGSTLNGTIGTRPAIPVPAGLFVQTFNANGLALGDHGPRIDGGDTPALINGSSGDVNVGVTALDDGGYAVHWVVDSDGDLNGDGLAVQRFAANGTAQGGVTVLQGLSPDLLNAADV